MLMRLLLRCHSLSYRLRSRRVHLLRRLLLCQSLSLDCLRMSLWRDLRRALTFSLRSWHLRRRRHQRNPLRHQQGRFLRMISRFQRDLHLQSDHLPQLKLLQRQSQKRKKSRTESLSKA
ncbi:hypothetical protein LB503_009899 [Fusarium chuoi]|nr:hypothetical protein LB503_009899 [Fusarium chuoi]